jgi:hypothetical protein
LDSASSSIFITHLSELWRIWGGMSTDLDHLLQKT